MIQVDLTYQGPCTYELDVQEQVVTYEIDVTLSTPTYEIDFLNTVPGPTGPALVQNWQGVWDNATNYVAFDGVDHEGSSYVALQAHTNTEPGTDPATWQLLAEKGDTGQSVNWLGAWDSGTTYAENDAVTHAGSSWRGLAASLNVEPDTDPTKWEIIAEKGDAGADGAVWHVDTGAPGAGTGADGDLYIDDANGDLYGPKAAGAWGSPIFRIVRPPHGSIILIPADTAVTVADDGDPFWIADSVSDGYRWESVVIDVTGTVGTGGDSTFMLRRVRGGVPTDLLTTAITVEDGEDSSDTAPTPPVFDGAELGIQEGDRFYIDRDTLSSTAPNGLAVRFTTKI